MVRTLVLAVVGFCSIAPLDVAARSPGNAPITAPHRLYIGMRVRVTSASSSRNRLGTVHRSGIYLGHTQTSLLLSGRNSAERLEIPREDITAVDASFGSGDRGRGAIIGGLVGLLSAGVVGNVWVNGQHQDSHVHVSGMAGAVILAPLGAAVGALLGVAVSSGPQWRRVPLDRVFGEVAKPSGLGTELALRFRF